MSDLETPSDNPEGIKKAGNGWGGKRAGAGQPPNAQKYKRQIAKATDTMGRMLPEAAAATVDLATGAYYLLVYNPRTKNYEKPRTEEIADSSVEAGLIKVYRELPNIKAIEVMFERLMGKVPQPVDVTVRQAVADVMEAQEILMRVIEEHVPAEYLPQIRAELDRVARHHSNARAAVGIE